MPKPCDGKVDFSRKRAETIFYQSATLDLRPHLELLPNFCQHLASKPARRADVARASIPEAVVRTSSCRLLQLPRVEIVDKRLKSMMRELGDAINNSLSDSEQIADVIARIKAGGYDVFVVLEATIGFNQHDQSEPEPPEHSSADFKITAQDLKFLKSLRIRVEED
jgi:hypothetical protein